MGNTVISGDIGRCHGHATSASTGIAIGRVQKVLAGRQPIPEYNIDPDETDFEIKRLRQAVDASVLQLDKHREKLSRAPGKDPALILDAHRMLLLDPQLTDAAVALIRREHINAEWALRRQLDDIESAFDEIEDEYLRSKKLDVEQVGQRVLCNLLGSRAHDLKLGGQDTILVGEIFSPGEVVQNWQQGLAGFISEQGGANSHSIIVARGIELPALTGTTGIISASREGDTIILDGNKGIWILNPGEHELGQYQRLAETLEMARSSLSVYAQVPSVSASGHKLPIMANLEFTEELALARKIGVEGIGLYRTEFFILNYQHPPTEEDQFLYYRKIVEEMDGKPVTFRLFDVGGDKPTLFQKLAGQRPLENNPAMGLRGIRLLLHYPEILRTQLRAMVRVAMHGPVSILVPMVANIEEMIQTRIILSRCQQELGCNKKIPLGTMIEIPAAALIASKLAEVSDFFSIGTNDLIQYTVAVDRGNEEVAELYDPGHLAVQHLLEISARAASQAGIPVSICGEMAGDPAWTETLMNMGFDYLSMSLSSVLEIRQHLSTLG